MSKGGDVVVDALLDRDVLAAYEAWVAVFDKARADVAAGPLVKITPNGHEQKVAALDVLRTATEQVLKLAKELGRTPAARARLGVDTERSDELPDLPTGAPAAWGPDGEGA